MAAPIAVSSWKTFVESPSLGSTVLLFLIIGSGTTPSCLSMTSWSLSRRIQRLLVLKYLCLETSWNAFSSSSAHCADSRRRSCPSCFLTARWPPFLSAGVRSQTSIMKGLSESAKKFSSDRSRVAPRLSELETNMYFTPASRSFLRVPEPASEGYRSPCPGGHHSLAGLGGNFAGRSVDASILGTLFCTTSQSPLMMSGCPFSASLVSALVEKEFMNIWRTEPLFLANHSTWEAMRSRKDCSPLTDSSDLAFSSPMPVPRPPLSFMTTVFSRSFWTLSSATSVFTSARVGRSSAGVMAISAIMPSSPLTRAS
mmetsp:Transcript_26779/g.53802  ORF Transcript_26779/g.53802 Transcript_26779/m.53802 type:complete len:312 (-) Transcript_26779:363-1298(-)